MGKTKISSCRPLPVRVKKTRSWLGKVTDTKHLIQVRLFEREPVNRPRNKIEVEKVKMDPEWKQVLTESERVTGDSKLFKHFYSMKPHKGFRRWCYKITFETPLVVKGEFRLQIGDGRMDIDYSTCFLDPKIDNHHILLASTQLDGTKKPSAGQIKNLRQKGLRVQVNLSKFSKSVVNSSKANHAASRSVDTAVDFPRQKLKRRMLSESEP